MSEVRLYKWTGHWPEAVQEMDKIEEEIALKLDSFENDQSPEFLKYLKLNARVLRERMTIQATSKRFEEA